MHCRVACRRVTACAVARCAVMEHFDPELARRFLAAELDPATQQHWETHLRDCERCRALLANERKLAALLDLGTDDEPAPPDSASKPETQRVSRVLERVDAALPQRGGKAGVPLIALLLANVMLAVLLAWQIARQPPSAAELARELRIGEELQRQAVGHLDALGALRRDPWLEQQYGVVERLDQLINGGTP